MLTNLRIVHELITHPSAPSLTVPLKALCLQQDVKMILKDTRPPSSHLADVAFLNKVAFLASTPCHSTYWPVVHRVAKPGFGNKI